MVQERFFLQLVNLTTLLLTETERKLKKRAENRREIDLKKILWKHFVCWRWKIFDKNQARRQSNILESRHDFHQKFTISQARRNYKKLFTSITKSFRELNYENAKEDYRLSGIDLRKSVGNFQILPWFYIQMPLVVRSTLVDNWAAWIRKWIRKSGALTSPFHRISIRSPLLVLFCHMFIFTHSHQHRNGLFSFFFRNDWFPFTNYFS